MISFPNAKINLGLNIIRKREDGYHDLETVFYPILMKDVVEIVQNNTDCSISGIKSSELNVEFSCSGLPVETSQQNNLCVKAYHLLKKDLPSLPSVKIHLHKNIPMGAGLGGGSADAAFTLKLLNTKFNLNLSDQQLIDYALQLGSDCPFFIINQPCFATSRGEKMEKIDLDLSAYKFVIVNPGIHVSTAWAFAQIVPQEPKNSIKNIIQQPVPVWKDLLKNDFEDAVMKQYPAIHQIKENLYNAGAAYVSMSGSGSTVYGIFEKNIQLALNFPQNYFTQIL
ncbi:4-diphosphocytidyl-2-C-methyl-D-erythritol kinase [mine drainage metagenome]|uniref:4-(cytidine 5'-diphospho)-2-C-methyl-D-erythritol kinase n=1 Tax=mine drainage metagenome TaxID=410659 RepID=A0A1J5S2J2_9ZZZZ